jgi:hypothetical protein
MAHDLSLFLAQTIERELPNLRAFDDERASIARAPGKWSPQEELGHLIDWVRLNGYRDMKWETIIAFWFQYNILLAGLVGKIPQDRLGTLCFIGANQPVTLGFVIEDYIRHMQHHIDQLLGRQTITTYPGATAKD